MSELIVVGFRDQYRAAEVLNELKRRDWDWVGDLNDAVTVTVDANGKARVQLSLDLSNGSALPWATLWGSLLGVTLLVPTGVIAYAANAISVSAVGSGCRVQPQATFPNAAWWKDDFRLSETFVRDVGAVVNPGVSAMFMFLRTREINSVLRQLHNYGGMIIHTTLSPEQDAKMSAVLAPG